jgi:hypothetical protein
MPGLITLNVSKNGSVSPSRRVTIDGDRTYINDEIALQAENNPSNGGGGTIRTAGSRYTMVFKPRTSGSAFADDSEFYYDSAANAWISEVKLSSPAFGMRYDGMARSNLGAPMLDELAVYDAQFTNKLQFYDPSKFTFEYTNDGSTWIPQAPSTSSIKAFVAGTGSESTTTMAIPNGCQKYRITIRNSGPYVYLNSLYSYWSSKGNVANVQMWKKRDDGNWTQHTFDTTDLSSWPGHLTVPFSTIPWSLSSAPGHYNDIRIEFNPTWNNGNDITLSSLELWGGYPAGKRQIFDWDSDKRVRFPNTVRLSASDTSFASLNIPSGSIVTSPADGDIWKTSSGFYYRNGSTNEHIPRVTVSSAAPGAPVDGDLWIDSSAQTWTDATFQNGWSNYNWPNSTWSPTGFIKDSSGVVRLRGLVVHASASYATIFTLPAGYRPPYKQIFICQSGGGIARVDIQSDGQINVSNYLTGSNSHVAIDTISFLAA